MAKQTVTGTALRWHRYADPAAVAAGVSAVIAAAAAQAIAARSRFVIVLAGGTTPKAVYARLVDTSTDWSAWRVYFGDERCLPAGHPERNDSMAGATWLEAVAIPASAVHRVPAEFGPAVGARRYADMLSQAGEFDLTLLGIGEDGHTASLFPGHALGDEPDAPAALAVTDAPKPPADRVSMSAARLSRSRQVIVIATGAGKRAALRRLAGGEELPIGHVQPAAGIDIHVDRAAAPDGE